MRRTVTDRFERSPDLMAHTKSKRFGCEIIVVGIFPAVGGRSSHTSMSADQETVTADQPTRFPRTRAEALESWAEFRPRVAAYAEARNGVRPGHRAVSRLSPAIRRRLVTEYELIESTLAEQPFARVEKFVQEMCWRRYWKSWLELRPGVWSDYQRAVRRLRGELRGYQARRVAEVEAGQSGVEIMDYFADELRTTGYLHNHARMWFAGFWVHTEKLPWEIGADFFYRHLLDADPAANTLSWRWVAGIQTQGKSYLTRRSNLERYVDPDLLAAHAGGLEKLDDKLAQPARVQDGDFTRAEMPEDADDTALPDGLPGPVGRVGTCRRSAPGIRDASCGIAPAGGVRRIGQRHPPGGGSQRATARLFGGGVARRGRAGRDAFRSAGSPRGRAAAGDAGCPCADTGVADGGGVAARRRAVAGALVAAVRARLARENVALHLVWRPEDAQTLPFARSGYFSFWQAVREELLGAGGGEREREAGVTDHGQKKRGKHSHRRKDLGSAGNEAARPR